MTEITRLDLLNYIGKGAHAKYNTLSNNGLGHFKQMRIIRENASIRHKDVIRNIKHFNVDECILFFKEKIENEKIRVGGRFKKQHIKNWNEIIKILEYFKQKED